MQFSILTPSYNQGKFLTRNIQSVQSQDVKGTQHIIIDGGSTDQTVEILNRFDHQLHYWCSEKDKGQGDALNKGLTKATGDIVGWLNVDEFYEQNIFARVAEVFETNPDVVLVYGDFRRVLPDTTAFRVNRQWRFDYEVCRIKAPIVMNCAAFFRRDRLIDCGGFDASWYFVMDWELYMRFMQGDQKWVHLKKILGNFTMHKLSKTSSAQDILREEIKQLRARQFPSWDECQIERWLRRQARRAAWHMLLDGVLWEKMWFKLFRQRHYAAYFGDPGVRLPVVSRLLDWAIPPQPPSDDTEV